MEYRVRTGQLSSSLGALGFRASLLRFTTLIALFGFWRISPGITFIVATLALAGMIIAFWVAGKQP